MARFRTSKVNSWNGIPCLEWVEEKSITWNGYGKVGFHGKCWFVHRLVWTWNKGEIPKGVKILHHCDNPPCGEIEHLYPGTQIDNMRDAERKGRVTHDGWNGQFQGHGGPPRPWGRNGANS
jgi:hypothetical protein